jgi:hypothetical protein
LRKQKLILTRITQTADGTVEPSCRVDVGIRQPQPGSHPNLCPQWARNGIRVVPFVPETKGESPRINLSRRIELEVFANIVETGLIGQHFSAPLSASFHMPAEQIVIAGKIIGPSTKESGSRLKAPSSSQCSGDTRYSKEGVCKIRE